MGKYRISGLAKYFHHCEVMENKDEKNYLELAAKNDMEPQQILMIGNSVKSDICQLKEEICRLIDEALNSNTSKQGFTFYIDDLDRIDGRSSPGCLR